MPSTMQEKQGYKKTELGWIPEGWDVLNYKSFGECIRGVSYKPEDLITSCGKDDVILLRSNNIANNSLNFRDVQILNKCKVKQQQILKPLDITICMSNGSKQLVGKAAQFTLEENKYTVGAFCAIFRPNISISSKYAKFLFETSLYYNQLSLILAGTSINNLKNSDIESLQASIPPIKEQQKIAKILSTVDEKIEKVDNQIEQAEQLKKALMQELLTNGIGHTEFKDTELGSTPNSWGITPLGKVARLQGGYAFSSSDSQESGAKWLKIANVSFRKVDWSAKSYLPQDYLQKYSDYVLKQGDIVIAMTRPLLGNNLKIAKILECDENCLLNQRVGKLFGKSNIDNDFLYYLVQTENFIRNIQLKLLGSDPPNISSEMFESTLVPLPTIEEQEKIADILNSADEKIEILQNKKSEYVKLKKGLMQKLLTGQIRVRV